MQTRFLKRAVCMGIFCAYLTIFPSCVSAQEGKSVSESIIYDFENGAEDWEYSSGNYPAVTFESVTEDSNSFMRFTAPMGSYSIGNYMLYENPHAYLKIDGGFELAPDSETVISAKMRTNTLNLSDNKQFLFGVPTDDETARTFCTGVGIKTLWDISTNNLRGSYVDDLTAPYPIWHFDNGNEAYGNNKKRGTPMLNVDNLQTDAWYTIKAIITSNSLGNPQKIRYEITGENGFHIITNETDGLSWSLYENKSVDRLDFAWFLRNTTFPSDATFDIDDVKIYKPKLSAKIVCNFYEGIIVADASFPVKFDTGVDSSLLNADTVILYNESGEKIECTGEYDIDANTYTLTPINPIPDGAYTVKISGENLKVADERFKDDITFSDIEISVLYYNDVPPLAPECQSPALFGTCVSGQTLYLTYKFFDINGDRENESVIKWYRVLNDTDTPTVIDGADGLSYTLKDSDVGYKILCGVTPVSENAPYEGNEAFTEFSDAIKAKDDINMFGNAGFENSTLDPWYIPENYNDLSIEISDKEKHSGNQSLYTKGKTNNSSRWGQKVHMVAGKTYIIDGYAKADDNSPLDSFDVEGYCVPATANANKRPYRDQEVVTLKKGAWYHVASTVSAILDSDAYPLLNCFPSGVKGFDYYADDMYFGELLLSDISANIPKTVTIPKSGEITFDIESFAVNQLGFNTGLYDEEITLSLDNENERGVYISDGRLTVTNEAYAGKIKIIASCVPHFAGSNSTELKKIFVTELLANDDEAPKISNLTLLGTVRENAVLTLSYDYYQINRENDDSIITWLYANSENGSYSQIPNASGETFTVTEEYKDCFIKAEIIPKTESGITGTSQVSNVVGAHFSPVARNVKISHDGVYTGAVLTGEYEYFDFNRDAEGETKFKWLRAMSENGSFTEIEGATEKTYTLTEDDTDKFIKFQVIPISTEEPYVGTAVPSTALSGPARPSVTDVKISASGKYLTGSYKYVHPYNIPEGNSEYKWLVGGKVVSTDITYQAKSGEKVTFQVTPVSQKAPFTGETKTASYTVGGKTNGVSTGGSGGGGGGGSFITSEADKNNSLKPQEEKPVLCTDIENHWAKDAITEIITKNIMPVSADKKFYPDKNVLRGEVIVYTAKVLGFSGTPYKDIFGDVTKSDAYADILQELTDAGIISPYDNFYPNRELTREELCKIVIEMLRYKNKLTVSDSDTLSYSDTDDIQAWAKPYVSAAQKSGIMIGVGNNMFMPKKSITNAELATMLIRIIGGLS